MRWWARWRRWWLLPRSYARSLLAAFALLTAYFVPAISAPGCAGPGGRECGRGLSACPAGCVDTLTDPLHCGTCGVACPPETACWNGACVELCAPEPAAVTPDHASGS
ncbi:MAG TPA: hypothetical protein VGQ83_04285 [Polyangia bacterium]